MKIFTSKKGFKITLRTPAEKARRFADQLKKGKIDETGKKLTKSDRSYRHGYLNARNDNSKAFKHNESKKTKKS